MGQNMMEVAMEATLATLQVLCNSFWWISFYGTYVKLQCLEYTKYVCVRIFFIYNKQIHIGMCGVREREVINEGPHGSRWGHAAGDDIFKMLLNIYIYVGWKKKK